MFRKPVPIGEQLAVLVPTLLMSLLLGFFGVPVLPRVVSALGFGMLLIAGVTLWRRRRSK